MKYKTLITGPGIADEAMRMLESHNVEAITIPLNTEATEIARIAAHEQVDAMIIRTGDINKAVIEASECLKIIAKHGVGVNNIDMDTAARLGIPVTITRGANSRAVAEHAFAMMFAIAKDFSQMGSSLRQGNWEKATYKGVELSGKVLGIIGFGSIGKDLASLVQPLNMPVLAFDPYAIESDFPNHVTRVDNLKDLLQNADVVSLHCPLTEDNHNLIGTEQLALMKRTATLINTARGELIDESALVMAIREGGIAGAGLDSFLQEPTNAENALWEFPNVVVTPHVAGVTSESMVRMGVAAVESILQVLKTDE